MSYDVLGGGCLYILPFSVTISFDAWFFVSDRSLSYEERAC